MKKGMRLLLVAGALLFVVLLAACDSESSASEGSSAAPASGASAPAAAMAADSSQPQGISVSGEGRVSLEPDVALVNIGVSAKEMTVAEANSKVQAAHGLLLDSLKGNGVEEKDIQTSQFSIQPEYDYQYDRQKLTGYRVTHMLRVKVRQIDLVGKVIDDGVEAAGDLVQVHGISFSIDDPSAARSEARQKAMADAEAKADELASLAGVSRGKATYITESVSMPHPIRYAGAYAAPATGGYGETIVSPGELEVVVNVSVTYGIE